jgi:hypothetical protein
MSETAMSGLVGYNMKRLALAQRSCMIVVVVVV